MPGVPRGGGVSTFGYPRHRLRGRMVPKQSQHTCVHVHTCAVDVLVSMSREHVLQRRWTGTKTNNNTQYAFAGLANAFASVFRRELQLTIVIS